MLWPGAAGRELRRWAARRASLEGPGSRAPLADAQRAAQAGPRCGARCCVAAAVLAPRWRLPRARTSHVQMSPLFQVMGTLAMERNDHPSGICEPPMQSICLLWTR